MKTRYPPIEPNRTGFLQIDGHEIYWEESGNPKGLPVIFLHGGPGSGTSPTHRSYFHPAQYRIILMDQRGCGLSRPHGSLHHNTTWHLVEDIEHLRKVLKIEKWVVFGGSWGSTLGLAYAQMHPERVLNLIVRGIFLGSRKEVAWLYQEGASRFFPDSWEQFAALIPEEERRDLLKAYHKRLLGRDARAQAEAALAWAAWEAVNLKLIFDPALFANFTAAPHALVHAQIEAHYFINHCFFKTENWLLEQIDKIQHIPGTIVQGRYDMMCPFENAWKLHKAWPKAHWVIVPDAGHSASEPGITDALVGALDQLVAQGRPIDSM